MPSPVKVEFVEKIKKDISALDGIVLADFKGLSVPLQDELRKKIDKLGGSAKVMKNTLLKKALEGSKIGGLDSFLVNNTIVFSSNTDIMSILKALSEFSKQHEKLLLKGGFLDGRAFDRDGILEMARMPSRQEILAMIAGNMSSMISGFTGVLSSIITKFTGTLESLEKKKS